MAPLTHLLPFLPLLHRRAAPKPAYKDPNYIPGGYAIDPTHVNNKAFFALFALLGIAMVCASIWFFFWAKNGGCIFRRGDWDDYKSTVLRRKGPDGKTLSGATRTTRLGGGSVVADGGEKDGDGGWRRGEQNRGAGGKEGRAGEAGGKRGNRNGDDEDMRAYRHEKPARVGGLNREMDGVMGRDYVASRYGGGGNTAAPAYTDDSRSTVSGSGAGGYVPINTPRKSRPHQQQQQKHTPTTPITNKAAGRHGGAGKMYATPASNGSTDSHRPLRQRDSGASTPTRTPRNKRDTRSIPGSFYTEPLDFDVSEVGTEDSRGTKAYFHPLPKMGKQSGGGGFRRGGGYGRGDLSDDE